MKKCNLSPEKERKKSEKGTWRNYFLRILGKYNFRDEKQFVRFAKWLIFIVLVVVEIFTALQHINNNGVVEHMEILIALLVVEAALTLSQACKLFIFERANGMFFYALDMALAGSFMYLSGGVYPIVAYMLVLTEFYFGSKSTKLSVALLCVSMGIYGGSYVLYHYVRQSGNLELLELLTSSLGSLLALVIHFLVVQVGLAFYRQFVKLDKTLAELNASKKELEKAYAVVAEVTALEERQRIAKEIHDTAGHSITTVIMQTEAAKRIIEKSPEEAKSKIVAANLQAKHALEELRDSVHLLSGVRAEETLQSALQDIIHESTDGTGITIRSEIEALTVSPTKQRFLCNTLKEGISNGLRHGGATAFWFECKKDGDKIVFLLSDNGKGVGADDLKIGFGLSSMRERAKSLGGELRLDSEEGEGFELRLLLPTDKWDKEKEE